MQYSSPKVIGWFEFNGSIESYQQPSNSGHLIMILIAMGPTQHQWLLEGYFFKEACLVMLSASQRALAKSLISSLQGLLEEFRLLQFQYPYCI